MCGIVGYIGDRDTTSVLIDGLRKLEYRGYDSAGIAVIENGSIRTVKTKGRLDQMEEKVKQVGSPEGHCGIGHTRWATHGEPSDVNSHPHGNSTVTIVHNGIIENYLQLKEFLTKKGYQFESETDTESVAKLLDYFYHGDPLAAIKEVITRIRGSYALGILFKDFPDQIFAVRKDSPLIVGLAEGENFIASDIPAILKYTNRYYLLEENEIAILEKDCVQIVDIDGMPIDKEVQTATWNMEAAEKGGYPHFMLKEIHEEPKALRDTISPRIVDGLPEFENISSETLKQFERIYIVACGTAMHAGMIGKLGIERLARIPVDVDLASEFRHRNPVFGKKDLAIFITQSGETADTLAALRLCKSKGVHTLGVVNVVGSSIAREADSVIYTWAGPEIAVASTKAYSVQVSVMYLLAIKLGLLSGNLPAEEARDLTRQLAEMPEVVEKSFEQAENVKHIAALCQNTHDLFFIGRGLDNALSMEGSLKLKEISYIHSEAYAAGELKHGPISLVVDGIPVIAIATQDALFEKMLSNIKEVKARGAKVLLICIEGVQDIDKICDYAIVLPKMNDFFAALPGVAMLQMFAYYTSVLRGCDVDKPRNLAKSVTVE